MIARASSTGAVVNVQSNKINASVGVDAITCGQTRLPTRVTQIFGQIREINAICGNISNIRLIIFLIEKKKQI